MDFNFSFNNYVYRYNPTSSELIKKKCTFPLSVLCVYALNQLERQLIL